MSTVATSSRAFPQAPTLRLLPRQGKPDEREVGPDRRQLRLLTGSAPAQKPILLAGGDSGARAAVQHDLAKTMPRSTKFELAGALWEVLVRAPEASMVILSGELEEISAESVMQMLAHRHPGLAVVSIDADDDAISSYA
ncbi:MAG TPA: hypothetical protein VK605_00480 [Solirubrobacteraceae bacterium]|nr:hypothetical protein [Solirubrobacteraceae bacterium]